MNKPDSSPSSENYKQQYIHTDPTSWTVLKDGQAGRNIEPIPYNTDESEEFSIKIRDEELAKVKDDNGDI